jgi:hypothetical protein
VPEEGPLFLLLFAFFVVVTASLMVVPEKTAANAQTRIQVCETVKGLMGHGGDDDWAQCPLETDTGALSLSDFLWDRGEATELFVGSRAHEQEGRPVASWYLESAARVQPWDLVEYSEAAPSPSTTTKAALTQNAGPIDLNLVEAVPLEPLARPASTAVGGEGSVSSGGGSSGPVLDGGKPAGLQGNFDSEISWAQETLWSRDFRRSLWEHTPKASKASAASLDQSAEPAPAAAAAAAAAAVASPKAGTVAVRGSKRKEGPEDIIVIDVDGPGRARQAPPGPTAKRGRGGGRGRGRKK